MGAVHHLSVLCERNAAHVQEIDVVGIPEGASAAWRLLGQSADEAVPLDQDTDEKTGGHCSSLLRDE